MPVHSVHGLKSIGYVQLSVYEPAPRPKRITVDAAATKRADDATSKPVVAVALAVLTLVAAFTIPYVYK